MTPTTRSRSIRWLLAVLAVGGLVLAGCSSDDDGDSSSTTDGSGDTSEDGGAPPSIPLGEDVDLETLNAEMQTYIEETFPGTDASNWEITAVDGPSNGVTIGPSGDNDPDIDDARQACEAFASIVYSSLPTAVIDVQNADGDVVVTSGGPGGSCVET